VDRRARDASGEPRSAARCAPPCRVGLAPPLSASTQKLGGVSEFVRGIETKCPEVFRPIRNSCAYARASPSKTRPRVRESDGDGTAAAGERKPLVGASNDQQLSGASHAALGHDEAIAGASALTAGWAAASNYFSTSGFGPIGVQSSSAAGNTAMMLRGVVPAFTNVCATPAGTRTTYGAVAVKRWSPIT
jgi:hypothetical protein